MNEIAGVVGIIGLILAIIITGKICKVIFQNSIGTIRGYAGVFFVVFCITMAIVWMVLGGLLGMGQNALNSLDNGFSGNSYSENTNGYSQSYDSQYSSDYGSDYSSDYSGDYPNEDYDDSWDLSDEYILPYSDYEYLEEGQLKNLSKEELRIARNEIFARHGRKFNDSALMAYFESTSWYYPEYEPDEFDSQMENILNAVEKENLQMIKNEESRR